MNIRSEVFPNAMSEDPKKVAIVHYWLTNMRGGERVLEALCEMFPNAVIFTNVVDRTILPESITKHEIRTTFIQKLPGSRKHYQKYLPLMPLALEQLDLTEFDLVISNESGPSKGVIVRSDALHICYCFSPMRYLWDFYAEYLKNASSFIRFFMIPTFHYLRLWDQASANRVDKIFSISNAVKRRIRRSWGKDSEIIFPPVDVQRFKDKSQSKRLAIFDGEPYYIFLGALVEYKKADLAIEACKSLNKNLLIIGKGPELKKLKKIASTNIKFVTDATDSFINAALYHAKAMLFPGEEDFGIVVLESLACETPVIAYKKGGALDTVTKETGIFFEHQSKKGLISAIKEFELVPSDYWKKDNFQSHVERFSKENFKKQFLNALDKAY